jgi:hypothetical protein
MVTTKRWYPYKWLWLDLPLSGIFFSMGLGLGKGGVATSREKDRCKKMGSDTFRLKCASLKTDKTCTLWHHPCIQLHTLKKLLQSSPWDNDRICWTPLFQRHARVVIESFTTVSEISKQEEDILWKVIPTLLKRNYNQWNGF